jgi:hypothetical protein
MEPEMLPMSVEVLLKIFRSTWSNGAMSWLTLEQGRLTMELWRLTQVL